MVTRPNTFVHIRVFRCCVEGCSTLRLTPPKTITVYAKVNVISELLVILTISLDFQSILVSSQFSFEAVVCIKSDGYLVGT